MIFCKETNAAFPGGEGGCVRHAKQGSRRRMRRKRRNLSSRNLIRRNCPLSPHPSPPSSETPSPLGKAIGESANNGVPDNPCEHCFRLFGRCARLAVFCRRQNEDEVLAPSSTELRSNSRKPRKNSHKRNLFKKIKLSPKNPPFPP